MELNLPGFDGQDLPADALDRAGRLAAGYLQAELVMRKYGIQQTIVAFGGTRVFEAEHAGESDPTDYYRTAREFGAIVGRSGRGPDDCRLTLMTGGGPGIMEAANRGASDVGAKSIGLNIRLPHEQVPNSYITDELSFDFQYFAIRKLHFLLRARALVVFPGGYGTMDELFETLNLVQCRRIDPLPVVLVGEAFWRQAVNLEFLEASGLVDRVPPRLYWYAESAQQIWESIVAWYEKAGNPLLCETP